MGRILGKAAEQLQAQMTAKMQREESSEELKAQKKVDDEKSSLDAEPVKDLACVDCGFKAASALGLKAHSRIHKAN